MSNCLDGATYLLHLMLIQFVLFYYEFPLRWKFLHGGDTETAEEPSGLGPGHLGRASATLLTRLMEPPCKAHTQILTEGEKIHIQKKKSSNPRKSS
jgi:hypothetical protein